MIFPRPFINIPCASIRCIYQPRHLALYSLLKLSSACFLTSIVAKYNWLGSVSNPNKHLNKRMIYMTELSIRRSVECPHSRLAEYLSQAGVIHSKTISGNLLKFSSLWDWKDTLKVIVKISRLLRWLLLLVHGRNDSQTLFQPTALC